MAVAVEVAPRRGREGSRWYNVRPTSEEIAQWFTTIPLHEGMKHEDYIGGLTLIQSKEKSNEVVGYDDRGLPLIQEREDLVFVPYVKIETRVAYFWNYVALHESRGWEGEIATVDPNGGEQLGLPPGFFKFTAAKPDGKEIKFVGCTKQVRIWEHSTTTSQRRSVMSPSQGTKTVSVATRWDVDHNAFMKAETGAVGRALGFAGMLVIPGSGVATAEDMLELSTHNATAAAEAAVPPAVSAADAVVDQAPSDEQMRERIQTLVEQLRSSDEPALERFQEWARGRKITLATAQGAALRGAIRKLEGLLEADGA
jgi:hypothetical protein